MAENQPTTIPHLKKDAVMMIQIGAGYTQRLMGALNRHLAGHEDETKALEAKSANPGTFEELTPWEQTAVTLTSLIQEIMKVAKENGQIEEVPIETVISPEMFSTPPND